MLVNQINVGAKVKANPDGNIVRLSIFQNNEDPIFIHFYKCEAKTLVDQLIKAVDKMPIENHVCSLHGEE